MKLVKGRVLPCCEVTKRKGEKSSLFWCPSYLAGKGDEHQTQKTWTYTIRTQYSLFQCQ